MERNIFELQAELINDSKLEPQEFVEKYAKDIRETFETAVQVEIDNRMLLEIDDGLLELWKEIEEAMKYPETRYRCEMLESTLSDVLLSKFVAKIYNNKIKRNV